MKNKLVKLESLTPFLSVILLKIIDSTFSIEALKNEFVSSSKKFHVEDYEGGIIYYLNYQEDKQVSWTSDEEIKDIKHHLFILYQLENYLVFYHSDKNKKNKLYSLLKNKNKVQFKKLKLLNKEVLYSAFIQNVKIKSLWLSNVHSPSEMKASSKYLSGTDLEQTLDPIGDQSYGFTALKIEYQDGSTRGVNALKSNIWMTKVSNNFEFFDELVSMIRRIITIEKTHIDKLIYNPISALANSHNNLDILNEMIDITLNDIEPFDENDNEFKLLNFGYDFFTKYNLNYEKLENKIYIIKISENQKLKGELKLTFSEENGVIKVKIDSQFPNSEDIEKLLVRADLVRYYFSNSQTIVNGEVYKQKFRDIEFDNFEWYNFDNHNPCKEKPTDTDFSLIGQDDSLFSWIYQYWNGTKTPLVDYGQTYVEGWLVCDDGAGEKADFIHITDEIIPTISLIHAKGAHKSQGQCSKDRKIAVTPYEVVVSQAIKNIKYLDNHDIALSIENANQNVKNLVWHNGKQSTRKELKKYLESLEQHKKKVVVLQPHVIKSKYTDIDNKLSDTQKLQRSLLNNLLVSAQNTVQSLGAKFVVIGSENE